MKREPVLTNPVILDFNVEHIAPITIEGPSALVERRYMSPFVWLADDGGFAMLLRAWPAEQAPFTDSGVIWHGFSQDGIHFLMDREPLLSPGPESIDIGGCEDPTGVRMEDGSYVVYYTGG